MEEGEEGGHGEGGEERLEELVEVRRRQPELGQLARVGGLQEEGLQEGSRHGGQAAGLRSQDRKSVV